MGVMFDILGMLTVRAAIVMVILNLIINLHEALYKNSDRLFLNESITAPEQVISSDINLAGPDISGNPIYKKFLTLGNSDMKFYAVDTSGKVYTARYYLSGSVLYRTIRFTLSGISTTMEVARNVTDFRVRYYKSDGSRTTSTADNVKSVLIHLTIISTQTESVSKGGTSDVGARTVTWEQHFFPENL